MSLENYIDQLDNVDGNLRRRAALALGAMSGQNVAQALLDRLGVEQDSCVREDLTWAVAQHIDRVELGVLAMLGSSDPQLRATAAHVLSKTGKPQYFDAAVTLLNDPEPHVAIKAYRATANTKHPNAPAALAACLGKGDQLERDALTAALALAGVASVGVLLSALESSRTEVREHAADVLGQIGDPDADRAAGALARHAIADDYCVALAAVSALAQLGKAADQLLLEIEQSGTAVSAVAREFRQRRVKASE